MAEMSRQRASVAPTDSSDAIEMGGTSNGTSSESLEAQTSDEQLVKYFRKTFNRRECKTFLEEKEGICQCGQRSGQHSSQAIKNGIAKKNREDDVKWNANEDTETKSTDAFGDLEFPNQSQTCRYVRVEHNTNIEKLVEMMKNKWELDEPNLLISVTGGAKNFKLKPQLKEVFHRGLIKAADSTGAWIITGGTHAGVMKHVGEAIRDSAITRGGTKTPIVAIGIATWGCINNRDSLINEKIKIDKQEKYTYKTAYYKPLSSEEDKSASALDPNHTHFILVDNGTRNKFGVEITLRATLEREISKPKRSRQKHNNVVVPVVCVVLEGGPNTLETVKSAIEKETPVIVVEGSGRVADILAYAYNNGHIGDLVKQKLSGSSKSVWDKVHEKLTENFPNLNDIGKYVDLVKYCVKDKDRMTVFSLSENGSAVDIDVTILKALLKVNRERRFDQLRLALAWNRVDVAKEEILTDDVEIQRQELENLMYTAMLDNKVDFVKLFLEKGLVLEDFLTDSRRIQLYNEPITKERCPHLCRYAKKGDARISLKNVGDMMKMLMNEMYRPMYCSEPWSSLNSEEFSQFEQNGNKEINIKSVRDSLDGNKQKNNLNGKPDDPAKELFFWSMLVHMKEMALVFWSESKDDMALALNAQMMLRKLAEKESDSDIGLILEKHAMFYENLAVDVLRECYKSDQRKATLSLVRNLPNFGGTTVLAFAVESQNLNLISHPACQSFLTMRWMGKLAEDNSSWKIFFTLFLPIVAPLVLTYREDDQTKNSAHVSLNRTQTGTVRGMTKQDSAMTLSHRDTSLSTLSTTVKNSRDCCQFKPKHYGKRLLYFFRAPVVRFSYYCISYFAFLVLYGIILLTDFRQNISTKEIILIIWVSSMLLEEIREVLTEDGDGFRKKLHNYFTDIWNILDVASISTYYVGLILRFIPYSICSKCLYAARIILALNLMIFIFRILHMFSVHRELGPKLVMIGRMMRDLFYFVIVLLVFVAAYGIASQVILYPNQPLNISLAKSVMSSAWWNLFGEFNIEEVSGENCPADDGSRTYNAKQCAELGYDTTNSTCWGKPDMCPAIDWFVPILLALYALISNVMMLNLLIAMFSNTFNVVQDNTNVLWKMQRYHLVKEYCTRPALPPPLIVISHLIIIVKYFQRKCFGCCQEKNDSLVSTKFEFKMRFDKNSDRELRMWEHVNAEEYLRGIEVKQQKTLENIVKETNKRVEVMARKVDEITTLNSGSTNHSRSRNTDDRLSTLESQLKRTTEALDWIMAAMSDGSGAARKKLSLSDLADTAT